MRTVQEVSSSRLSARKHLASLTSIALLAVALSPAGAQGGVRKGEPPATPKEMTAALKNRTARIDLDSGEVVAAARGITVGECFVSWRAGETREVPIREIRGITALERDRGLRGLTIGLGVGVGLGAIAAGSADSGTVADPALGAGAFLGSVLIAAPLGWGIGKLAKQPESRIYPAEESSEGPSAFPSCE